jgi:PAS domain S-box-containing protein
VLSGWHPNEVYGQSIRDRIKFVEQKSQAADFSSIEQALRSGTVSTVKVDDLLVTKEGKKIPIGHSTAPMVDHSGHVVGAIVVFRDITQEKEIEQAKTEIGSLVSHQLRTPLSAIGWYAELLLHGDAGKITDEQKEYVEEIYHGNTRMVELVNALLNVSRIELGTLAIEPEPTEIVGIAQRKCFKIKN